MGKKNGFTLVELMVVIAILGILAVSAIPFYQTWMQRAYGSEATVTMKKLMESQIMYFLEHNQFYPLPGRSVMIPAKGATMPGTAIEDVKRELKIPVVQGHRLNYRITNYGDDCYIIIWADFPLFKDGHKELHGQMDKGGKAYIFPAG